MIKERFKEYFQSFFYFYSYLGYRVFMVVLFTILVGILDGFGLTMFIPLLQMVSDSSGVDPESLGKLRFLVDFIEESGIALSLITILGFMLFFFIAKGIVQYFAAAYRINIRERFIESLRIQHIEGLNNLTYKYFVMSDVGRIQNTLTGEVDRVAISFLNYFTALQYGIMVLVYTVFAFSMDAQFSIMVTIGGILTNFLYKSLYKNTKGVSRQLTGENNNFQGLIIQNVANYKYLKATGSLEEYGKKLKDAILGIKDKNVKIGKLDALLASGREPLLIAVVVIVIFLQVTYMGSELGAILMILLFFYRALNYLMQMQVRWNKYLAVSGSLENMTLFGKELMNHKETRGKRKCEGEIMKMELSRVSFSYEENQVLDDIHLEIQKKQTVAFVGESGSGKTTLVNIVSGLLPVKQGDYLINGISSEELDLNSFQKKIGYITQDPVIFNDTLFNNITFWDSESTANKERFWEAAKQAAISEFIESLPEKENTVLGSNGVNLSGGQRQRISIARELYKKVEILILDEATSALDSETEKAIQQNIDNLKGNYTILIVAHRISTIKNADKIVVMKNGKITNTGSFGELVEKSEYFGKLVELQEI